MKYSIPYVMETGWPGQPYRIISENPAEVLLIESNQALTETELLPVLNSIEASEYRRQRASEFPTIEEVIVALLEKYEEGRPSAMLDILARRQVVKNKYPKPQ